MTFRKRLKQFLCQHPYFVNLATPQDDNTWRHQIVCVRCGAPA